MSRELDRRQLSRYLLAGLAAGSVAITGCTPSERTPTPDPDETGKPEPSPTPELDFDELVAELRSGFFEGPVRDVLDLDTLDPKARSDGNQIGICAEFQHLGDQPAERTDRMLAYAVAAGVTWLRTGFRYHDWDFEQQRPPGWLSRLLERLSRHGIRPLLQTSAREFLGTSQHTGRWLQLARAALDEWGEQVRAFQFYNEPHEIWSDEFGGGYWGGGWVGQYAAFVRKASQRLKATHPNLILVNGAHLPGVAVEQFRRTSPELDVVDWHNYPHLDDLPPELVGYARDQRFVAQASPSVRFEQVARDYRQRSADLLGGGRRQDPPAIWMTETGLPSETYGEQAQARFVARMYTLSLAAGIKTFCYQLADRAGQPERAAHFGLLDQALRPKPAFHVLGRISALTCGEVRADPAFEQARVVAPTLPGGQPGFAGTVGRRGRRIELAERIRAVKLDRADGAVLLAIWSTHPIDPDFGPRRVSVRLPDSYGRNAVLVDPLTGASMRLRTGTESALDVPDYPLFVLFHR